jgi:RNA polymerase sigma factor (sigma-70 family)
MFNSQQDLLEEELVPALQRGDNNALKYIYKAYWPMVLRFVTLNNGNAEDAEELYQEGIISLYEKVTCIDFKLTCSVKTFLYSICRNKWLNTLRGRKVMVDIEDFVEVLLEAPEDEKPEDEEVMDIIRAMGNPCHSLLVGYYYQKLDLQALAVKLQYASANVAKQQKFRCMERLKTMFLANKPAL